MKGNSRSQPYQKILDPPLAGKNLAFFKQKLVIVSTLSSCYGPHVAFVFIVLFELRNALLSSPVSRSCVLDYEPKIRLHSLHQSDTMSQSRSVDWKKLFWRAATVSRLAVGLICISPGLMCCGWHQISVWHKDQDMRVCHGLSTPVAAVQTEVHWSPDSLQYKWICSI